MRNCHDCGAKPGELHSPGCDTERCPRCGGQLISCDCIYEICGLDVSTLEEDYPDIYNSGPTEKMYAVWDLSWGVRRMPWTGEWPGVAECREYGWYSKFDQEKGWLICDKDDPGAQEDLNRLAVFCDWDQERQRYVKRGSYED